MSELTSTNWSETAGSNNQPTPNGWPEGQPPSTINDCAREMMSALKRWWNRDHASANVTVGGTANAITLAYSQPPAALVQGEKFAFKASAKNTGPVTVQVGTLAATNLYKPSPTGPIPLTGGEISVGQTIETVYDGTQFVLMSGLAAPVIDVSYLGRLPTIANNTGTPATNIDILPGAALDSTGTVLMKLGSTITKVVNSSGIWTAGSGGNGLDTGARTNSTWYHVFAIRKDSDGSVDGLFSLSATAPTMPAGYTYFRWIGAIKVDASGILKLFKQVRSRFYFKDTQQDQLGVTVNVASSSLLAVSAPPGIQTEVLFRATINASTSAGIFFTSPDENDQTTGASGLEDLVVTSSGASTFAAGRFSVRTDTLGNIRARAVTSSVLLWTGIYGWDAPNLV